MILTGVVKSLYYSYLKERDLSLNPEQFTYMLNLFPALLVVVSDGIVDKGEWTKVRKLSKILGEEFASSEMGEESDIKLTEIYRQEFKYLLRNRAHWEQRFIQALKSYFLENPGSKDFVMETMYLFAHATGGVSDEERAAIDDLNDRLALSE